jgi:23S rRNA (cytosine1962-C5)-methyltransferase
MPFSPTGMNTLDLPPLYLKKHEERRLRAGHLWVYSNEVDTRRSPLQTFTPGQAVLIADHAGKPLGSGYVNPHSLICARLVSRDPQYRLDRSLIVHRLNVALALRERLYAKPYYRLVYGESDALPGLVVDRYGDMLVAQLNTAGMEAARDAVIEALDKVFHPKAILLRNDSPLRQLEGLSEYRECALGEAPEKVMLEENGVSFEAPLGGQKTGWFYDHRENRARMSRYVAGRRVLDVFSYIGGWGIQAAVAGAEEVYCVDSSAEALDGVDRNAELNGVEDRVKGVEGNAFEALKALHTDGQRFDLVVVDPPAFIKRKKDLKQGLEGYRRINRLATQLLSKDGILISASCSHHLKQEQLRELLQQNARHLSRHLQIIEQGHQGPDHPIHPSIPETEYIKCLFGRLTPA